ncbi:N-acetylglucosaminyl-phosphatidylinositol de-N-acetylase [Octopus bimaculoides]|uniref:N-acetylglucosaminylphosphatidylinositol deacetylase n=1 Tax=Octopus bimaculoides TaxID=37653 RepID=A0A0L8HBA4_OCTBM|nr:N-acetylglucosaminyl-phosphatidylinositol de-N-acetylase [Octopus bimaculoides]|eukprot:XP_014773769.1 PREDICTED: N-acetylglucosaminyl-phosphatidylinositol de-N-acetylase-like [Octopus bimaculoides]
MLWGVFLHFLSVFIPFVCVSFLFYLLLSHFKSGAWRKEADKWQHLLVVTAHPDDECMFFSPSIFDFIRRQKHVSVLCFSDGNYMELADTRKKELYDSCRILGIQENNVQIVGDSCFPDDPSRIWNEELVARIILKHLLIIKPDVVLTFDQYGISGHNNHCSIYYGCRKLLQDGRAPTGINFYSLETTNILRKYVSFLDIPLSTVLTSKCYISTISAAIRAVRAMCAHSSQITWYRIAYLMFSRYMLINTLVDVLPGINMPR